MIEGIPLVDAHVHAARLPTLPESWRDWAARYGSPSCSSSTTRVGRSSRSASTNIWTARAWTWPYCSASTVRSRPAYSPSRTWSRFSPTTPPASASWQTSTRTFTTRSSTSWRRQISLGAVGLKLHPVHGSFSPNDRMLYLAYAFSEAEGLPVVFHCGTSVFPGSTNRYADPVLIEDVVRDFPDLTVVLAHGGRGWWYDAAAFITLMRPNVWTEVSGLPPQRLPHYYKNHDFEKLARKMIFGTDWPGVPGIEANALSLIDLGLERETVELILHGNAERVYRLDLGRETGSEAS